MPRKWSFKGHAMRGYQYWNHGILKIAQLVVDLLTVVNIQAFALAVFPMLLNIQLAAFTTASFSVQPAFVTYIWAILTTQKANYTLSDLLFLMTVLVFAYLVGLMVHTRSWDASSEDTKMPRCPSRHLGFLTIVECPWMEAKAAQNIKNKQESDQICEQQQLHKKDEVLHYIHWPSNEWNTP